MAVEEQTSGTALQTLGGTGPYRAGQKLTISNRIVSKLAFEVNETIGSPVGDITLTIRKVSDDSVMASKVWGDASGLSGSREWIEVTFDAPVSVNEEVRILCEYYGTDGSNRFKILLSSSDVKASEYYTRWTTTYSADNVDWDCIYRYTYAAGESGGYVFPSDAITRVTSLTHRYDRGTYTLELNLGEVVADFGLPEWDSRPKKAIPEEPVIPDIVEPVAPAVSAPQLVELTPYAKKIIKENKAAMEILQLRAKARELGVSEPSERAIEIFMKEPEKIAILQEIERMSRSAADLGITPYAREALQRAIVRKQAELQALYNQ